MKAKLLPPPVLSAGKQSAPGFPRMLAIPGLTGDMEGEYHQREKQEIA